MVGLPVCVGIVDGNVAIVQVTQVNELQPVLGEGPCPHHIEHRVVGHGVGDMGIIPCPGQTGVPGRPHDETRWLPRGRVGAERSHERRVDNAVVLERIPVAGVRLQPGGLDRHHAFAGRRHRAEKHRVRQVLGFRHHQPRRGTRHFAAHPHACLGTGPSPHPLHTHPLNSWL